jgi:hypothetical protein
MHTIPGDMVRTPIDFLVIKQRLHSNLYHRMQEFIDDMQSVFDLWEEYHGRDS